MLAVGHAAVREGPGRAGNRRRAHHHAVAVDRNHLAAGQRHEQRTRHRRRRVVGPAVVGHKARVRSLVVGHAKDAHFLHAAGGVQGDLPAVRRSTGVARAVHNLRGVRVAAAARKAAVRERPRGPAHRRRADVHAVAEHVHFLRARERRGDRAVQFRRRVVSMPAVGDRTRGRGHVVHDFRDRNRLRRGNRVHRDGVDVRHRALKARAILHHRRVGVLAVGHAGVREGPVRARNRGLAHLHAVAVDRDHLAAGKRARKRARKRRGRVVGLAAVRHHALHRVNVVVDGRDGHHRVRTRGLQRQAVRRGNRARVARRVFHHRRVAVRGAVAQPAVRVRPARARHRGLAHLHAVAVDRNHFVRAKRRAQRTAQFGQGVVRGAAVGDHALHGPHVVVNRIDAHRL